MTQNYLRYLLLLMANVLLVVAVLFVKSEGIASSTGLTPLQSPGSAEAANASCRYGSSVVGPYSSYLQEMGIGWVLNFSAAPNHPFPQVETIPSVRLSQPRDGSGGRLPTYKLESPETTTELVNLVKAYPGRIWQIGNEVDRADVQDDIMPGIYARAYHDLYYLIKKTDPTALVTPSGLVQVTPARIQYLDIVWNTYKQVYNHAMPVDVWNMHVYILPEARRDSTGKLVGSDAGIAVGTDPALALLESDGTPTYCSRVDVYCRAEHDSIELFKEQVVRMRQWMKRRGYQNTPLIMTEFSILYPYVEEGKDVCGGNLGCYTLYDEYGVPFSPTRVTTYMNATLDYLETATSQELGYPHDNYRLVQQWNWYAIHEGSIASSNNLVEDDGSALSMMGQNYKSRIAQKGFNVNLRLTEVHFSTGKTVDGTASVPLRVSFRNNGNTRITAPFQVTFYQNAALTQPIGSTIVSGDVLGCATHPYTAGPVIWSGLGPGIHRFWVKIDSSLNISETDESDNVGSGYVIVDANSVYLPINAR